MVEQRTWDISAWLGSFYLSIAQDPSEGWEAPWLKVIRVSLKVRSVYSNPEENSCLNACVLLRSESIVEPLIHFAEFSFAKGLAKVKLEGVVDSS